MKHWFKKSFRFSEISVGSYTLYLSICILCMSWAVIRSARGGFPVSISIVVMPRDLSSEFFLPNIRSIGRGPVVLKRLRIHPVRGAFDRIRALLVSPSLTLAYKFSDPEVSEFNSATLVYQNISTFDIPVDDSLFVKVVEALEHLFDVDCGQSFVEFSKLLHQGF